MYSKGINVMKLKLIKENDLWFPNTQTCYKIKFRFYRKEKQNKWSPWLNSIFFKWVIKYYTMST